MLTVLAYENLELSNRDAPINFNTSNSTYDETLWYLVVFCLRVGLITRKFSSAHLTEFINKIIVFTKNLSRFIFSTLFPIHHSSFHILHHTR